MKIAFRNGRKAREEIELMRFARRITSDKEILGALSATAHLSSLNQKRVLSFAALIVDWEAVGIIPVSRVIQGVSPEALPVQAGSRPLRRKNAQMGTSISRASRRRAMTGRRERSKRHQRVSS